MEDFSETPFPGGGLFADLIEEARERVAPAVDSVASVGVSHGELVGLVASVEELGRTMDSLRVLLAGAVGERAADGWDPEGTGLLAVTGCASAKELVARAAGVSMREAGSRVRLGGQLRPGRSLTGEVLGSRFPVVAAAVGAGLLGVEQRRAILRVLEPGVERGDPLVVAEAERCLVAAAVGGRTLLAHGETMARLLSPPGTRGADDAHADAGTQELEALVSVAPTGVTDGGSRVFAPPMTVRDLETMAGVWALAVDPDGARPDEAEVLAKRGITVGRLKDGLVPIRGNMIPEVAAQLQRLFDATLNPRVEEPAGPTVAGEDPGPDAAGCGTGDNTCPTAAGAVSPTARDRRTPAQRRHDALMAILMAAAGAKDRHLVQRGAPVLVVTASAEDLGAPQGAHAVAFLQGGHEEADSGVDIHAAIHAGCAGGIQKVLLDGDGVVLGSTSSLERVFTDWQRRAILDRDGACVIPGCETPGTWCEVHHVREWQDGGPTDVGNGVALCWFHHRFLHLHGWQIRMRDGVPEVKAPPWVDPGGGWMPGGMSQHRAHEQVRRRVAAARAGASRGMRAMTGTDGGAARPLRMRQ